MLRLNAHSPHRRISPPDRLEILRRAFDRTTKDPGFLADAQRMQADVDPQTGETVQKIVAGIVSTPFPVIDKLKQSAGLN